LLVEDVSEADAPVEAAAWAMPARAEAGAIITPPADVGVETQPPSGSGEGAAAIPEDAVPGPAAAEKAQPEREVFEIDLSGELDDLLSQVARPAGAPAAPPPAQPHPRGLDGFFEDLREERGRDLEGIGAALAYDQASEHFNRGDIAAAAACLRTAARDPLFRFRAASMLARIARDEQRLGEAIEWLERAAQAPAPTVEALHGLLYELGDILESSGEDARALAVFIELLAAAPGYRDVADRVASLSRRQAGPA
jgi:tetratricopeptide (TPR) repeat protein